MSERERLVAEIDAKLKRLVDIESESNRDIVEKALWHYLGGANEAHIDSRIRSIKDTINGLEEEQHSIQEDIDRRNRQLDVLREKLDQLDDEETYDDALDELSEIVQDGRNVFVGHGRVDDVATQFGWSPEKVVGDLKERNPDVSDEKFEERRSY